MKPRVNFGVEGEKYADVLLNPKATPTPLRPCRYVPSMGIAYWLGCCVAFVMVIQTGTGQLLLTWAKVADAEVARARRLAAA